MVCGDESVRKLPKLNLGTGNGKKKNKFFSWGGRYRRKILSPQDYPVHCQPCLVWPHLYRWVEGKHKWDTTWRAPPLECRPPSTPKGRRRSGSTAPCQTHPSRRTPLLPTPLAAGWILEAKSGRWPALIQEWHALGKGPDENTVLQPRNFDTLFRPSGDTLQEKILSDCPPSLPTNHSHLDRISFLTYSEINHYHMLSAKLMQYGLNWS